MRKSFQVLHNFMYFTRKETQMIKYTVLFMAADCTMEWLDLGFQVF